MRAGFVRRHRGQSLGRPFGIIAERAAGGGQQQLLDTDRRQAITMLGRQALEDGIVLGIDRQQGRPVLFHRIHEQLPGTHQRFLVGQQHALAGPHRRQCRQQASRTDDGGHHAIDFRRLADVDQRLLTMAYLDGRALIALDALERLTEPRSRLARGDHRHLRAMRQAQLQQRLMTRGSAERMHPITLGMARDHIQSAGTDGAGRTEDGDALQRRRLMRSLVAHAHVHIRAHAPPPSTHGNSRANSGTAAVRLSMRSITPP